MAQGARYNIYEGLRLYEDAGKAQSHGAYFASTVYDDRIVYHDGSVDYGTPYLHTGIVPWDKYYPAVALWWMPSWGGSGFVIGWVNDTKNGIPISFGNSSNKPIRAKAVYIGNSGNKPVKAVGLWIGGTDNKPKKAR